jgi:hypothetical protein
MKLKVNKRKDKGGTKDEEEDLVDKADRGFIPADSG